MPATAAKTPRAAQPALTDNAPSLIGDFLLLAGFALALRLAIAPWIAYGGDMGTFIAWGLRLAQVGAARFYEGSWCDYLPGYLYVLWPLGLIGRGLPSPAATLLFKTPNLLADIATAYLLWTLVRPTPQQRKLWLPALYLFNPAVLANSTVWGQVDSFHAFCLVAGLWLLLRKRTLCAAAVFGYAAAVKPHGIIILPLAALYILTRPTDRPNWPRSLGQVTLAGVVVVAVFGLLCLPFAGWSPAGIPHFIQSRVDATMGQYHFATINALNLWYLLGQNWQPDAAAFIGPLTIRQTGTLLFALTYAGALVWLVRRRLIESALWESAAIIYLATFLFVTRAHERHVFPYLAMMTAVAGAYQAAVIPLALLSLTYCINLCLGWRYAAHPSARLCHPLFAGPICLGNLALLPLSPLAVTESFRRWTEHALAALRPALSVFRQNDKASDVASPWIARRTPYLLAAIVLFALLARVVRLNAPPERYFDEVYHAYTAEQWLQGNTAPWLWSTHAPDKGCAYEWTHPPLAKLMMEASMKLFGVHPWAWRLPAALLGTANVLLVFLIARKLFECDRIALLAATLAALDTLPLVLSRIGMNDTYMVFFMLLAVLAALHRQPWYAALAIGLSLACKWSALYAFPLLALIHLAWTDAAQRWQIDRLAKTALAYALLVPAVYLASYIPFFCADLPTPPGQKPTARWRQFAHLQGQMWWYHTKLKATHPYSSPAFLWPLDQRPVWLYSSAPPKDDPAAPKWNRNVFAIGNPVVLLTGLGAMIFLAGRLATGWEARLAIVLAGYLIFWVPWIASPRVMFLYHYLPALPFLYIGLAASAITARVGRAGIITLLAVAGVVFLALYPTATALPIPTHLNPGQWRIG